MNASPSEPDTAAQENQHPVALLTGLFVGFASVILTFGFLWPLAPLFPAAVAERLWSKVRGKDDADLALPAKPLNAALERVFALERYAVGRLPLPPGLSLFAVASAT